MELPVIPPATPVVYTAIFGKFDALKPPLYPDDAKWVVLADRDFSAPSPWEVVPYASSLDPRKRSRYCKLHPHLFFPEVDITIWHGGNVQLTRPVEDYVNLLGEGEIAALPHPLRTTVWAEAETCKRDGKAPSDTITRQMEKYRGEGFPGDALHAAFLLIRRNSPAILALNELWWQQVTNHTIRDQLSFDYCLWKLEIVPIDIPFVRGSHDGGPYHRRYQHLRPRKPSPKSKPKKVPSPPVEKVKRVKKRPRKRYR